MHVQIDAVSLRFLLLARPLVTATEGLQGDVEWTVSSGPGRGVPASARSFLSRTRVSGSLLPSRSCVGWLCGRHWGLEPALDSRPQHSVRHTGLLPAPCPHSMWPQPILTASQRPPGLRPCSVGLSCSVCTGDSSTTLLCKSLAQVPRSGARVGAVCPGLAAGMDLAVTVFV